MTRDLDGRVLTGWPAFFTRGRHTVARGCWELFPPPVWPYLFLFFSFFCTIRCHMSPSPPSHFFLSWSSIVLQSISQYLFGKWISFIFHFLTLTVCADPHNAAHRCTYIPHTSAIMPHIPSLLMQFSFRSRRKDADNTVPLSSRQLSRSYRPLPSPGFRSAPRSLWCVFLPFSINRHVHFLMMELL